MPSISTITVADSQATPVNHDFVPDKVDGDIAHWSERTSSVAAGFWPLAISLRQPVPGASAKVYRGKLTFAMPITVVETVNGVDRTKVERVYRATVELLQPADGTLEEREDFVELLANLLDDTQVRTVLEDLEHVYG